MCLKYVSAYVLEFILYGSIPDFLVDGFVTVLSVTSSELTAGVLAVPLYPLLLVDMRSSGVSVVVDFAPPFLAWVDVWG